MHYFESKKREDFDASLSDEIKTVNIERAMSLLPELLKDAELVEHRGDLLAYGPAPYFHKPVLGRFPNWENGYIASRFGGMGINMSIGAGETMAHLIVDSEAPFETKQMVEILSPE
jgi:glycine/D-amino acid oxidase-like deaminating enzyme